MHFRIRPDTLFASGFWSFPKASVIFCLLVVFQTGMVYATAQPVIHRLTNEDGLSQNSVHSILQDSKGFLWISTENGLNRYDGYTFKTYFHDPLNPSSLSGNFTGQLFEDSRQNLWISTYGTGFCRFDRRSRRFIRYTDKSAKQNYSHNAIWAICEATPGVLWLGTFGAGLKRFDAVSGRITHRFRLSEKKETGLSGDDIRAIAAEKDGSLWIGSFDGGLMRFYPEKKRFIACPRLKNGKELPVLHIVSLLNDQRNSCVWVATHGEGLWRYDKRTKNWRQYQPRGAAIIRKVVADPKNPDVLWLADMNQGVVRLNTRNGSSDLLHHDPNDPSSLSDDQVLSLAFDRSGLLWAGTYGGGVNSIDVRRKPFVTIGKATPSRPGLSSSTVCSIAEVGNQVWVGTNDSGITVWDRKTGSFTVFSSAQKGKHFIPHDLIYFLMPDGKFMWAGCSGGLLRFDLKTLQYKFFPSPYPEGIFKAFTCGWKDKQGRYWFGTYGSGLARFDPHKEKLTTFRHKSGDSRTLSANTIFSLFEDSRGNFWVGTSEGGLNRMDRGTGTFSQLTNPALSSEQTIHAISEDKSGNLWAATSIGLVRITPEANGRYSFRRFTTKDGLPDNFVAGLIIDTKDRIWISTTRSIANFENNKIRDGKPAVTTYGPASGIANPEFSSCAFHAGKSGRLYFGNVKGLVLFDPDRMEPEGKRPQMTITGISLFNKPVEVDPKLKTNRLQKKGGGYVMSGDIASAKKLTLTYRENIFSLHFAVLDFGHPAGNKYQIKMDGFNSNWLDIGAETEATYTNLHPGNYTFHVRGIASDGIPCLKEATLLIEITPPWWQTWLFRMVVLLAIVAAVYGYIRRRVRILEREKQRLARKVDERTEEIRLQHLSLVQKTDELIHANQKLIEMERFKERLTGMLVHDLKNPLNGIVHMSRNVETESNKPRIAQAAKQMLQLVMNILDVQRINDTTLTVRKSNTALGEIVQRAVDYTELSARQKNLSVTVRLRGSATVHCDKELIERVLINLLSNAIQYSEANANIAIETENDNAHVLISVKDTGKGMTREQVEQLMHEEQLTDVNNKLSTGIGLQFCRLALDAHETKMAVQSEYGRGTTVSFCLKSGDIEGEAAPVSSTSPSEKGILTTEDFLHLSGFLSQLRACEVFEGGRILVILAQINYSSETSTEWKEEVQRAVYSINEIRYRFLTEQE